VSLGGLCSSRVVRYVQGPWGIHIDKDMSSMQQGEVRKWMDVPLQKDSIVYLLES
jgi:hypothetical protein